MNTRALLNPLQNWLLAQGRCVGCGRPLKEGKKKLVNGMTKVTCACQRVFVWSDKEESYKILAGKEEK